MSEELLLFFPVALVLDLLWLFWEFYYLYPADQVHAEYFSKTTPFFSTASSFCFINAVTEQVLLAYSVKNIPLFVKNFLLFVIILFMLSKKKKKKAFQKSKLPTSQQQGDPETAKRKAKATQPLRITYTTIILMLQPRHLFLPTKLALTYMAVTR